MALIIVHIGDADVGNVFAFILQHLDACLDVIVHHVIVQVHRVVDSRQLAEYHGCGILVGIVDGHCHFFVGGLAKFQVLSVHRGQT